MWWLHPTIVYLPKTVTYLGNNRAVSWLGLQRRESCKSNIQTTAQPSHHLSAYQLHWPSSTTQLYIYIVLVMALFNGRNTVYNNGWQTETVVCVYSTSQSMDPVLTWTSCHVTCATWTLKHTLKVSYHPCSVCVRCIDSSHCRWLHFVKYYDFVLLTPP